MTFVYSVKPATLRLREAIALKLIWDSFDTLLFGFDLLQGRFIVID